VPFSGVDHRGADLEGKNLNMKNWWAKRSTKKYYYCVFSESHSQPWMSIPIAQLASPQVIAELEKADQPTGAPSALPSLPLARPIPPANPAGSLADTGTKSISGSSRYTPEILAEIIA
jgi:hypothetical protein